MEKNSFDIEALFSNSMDMLCLAGLDGYFKRVNPAFQKILGYTKDELLSIPFIEFVHADDREPTMREVEKLSKGLDSVHFENRYRCKDGGYKWLGWMCPAPKKGSEHLYAVARDLTEIKEAQEALRISEIKLRKKNAALQEVLGQIEMEKKHLKEEITSNIQELILPILKKLKRKGNQLDRQYLEIMEKNFDQLTSSFGHKISTQQWNLTPKEIEICNMIKSGLSSKEIAATLNTSLRTVENHRNHIRTKLGLSGQKVNLVTYLKSV